MRRFVIVAAAVALLAALVLPHGRSNTAWAASNGKTVFAKNCSSCHGANGQGLVGSFPPLAKNPFETGDPSKVIHVVLNGLNGKVVVNGKTYYGAMPAWKGTLSNADIAAVITYVRSSWGNHASAVTAAQVGKTK